MSRESSKIAVVIILALLVVLYFAAKLFIYYEPQVELKPVTGLVKNCGMTSAGIGGSAGLSYCTVELRPGNVITVNWFGEIPMEYTGAVMIRRIKGKYTGRMHYQIKGAVNETHS